MSGLATTRCPPGTSRIHHVQPEHGFAVDRQTSGGTNAGLIFDTRDNGINPQTGSLASASYRTFFDGFLGGDSTWQELYLDARTYKN